MKLILLGAPGSGKGSISENLVKEFGYYHLSTGELLRSEIAKGTTLGKEIDALLKKGQLFPDEKMIPMVKAELRNKENYILDGFPRTIPQAEAIEDLKIELVISLEVSGSQVVERLSGRRTCPKCNAGYHIKYLPPKKAGICDKCGTALIQRADDNPETIKARFKVYYRNTHPLIEYYRKKGLLKIIDASPAPKVVWEKVKKLLKK